MGNSGVDLCMVVLKRLCTHQQKHKTILCVRYTYGNVEELIKDLNFNLELQYVLNFGLFLNDVLLFI